MYDCSHVYVHVHVCMYDCSHIYVQLYMHDCSHVHAHVCMIVVVYMYMHVCMIVWLPVQDGGVTSDYIKLFFGKVSLFET